MKIAKFIFPLCKIYMSMPIHSLAVFCGSKNGNNPLYTEHTIQLGKLLAKNNITLIYGGGNVGIMGKIADEVMDEWRQSDRRYSAGIGGVGKTTYRYFRVIYC